MPPSHPTPHEEMRFLARATEILERIPHLPLDVQETVASQLRNVLVFGRRYVGAANDLPLPRLTPFPCPEDDESCTCHEHGEDL